MKKIPTLYTKNSKGRYQEYKIPENDISNTLYGKVNGVFVEDLLDLIKKGGKQ